MPEAQLLPPNSGLRLDSLEIAFGRDTLVLSDLIAVFLIRDNLGKRPIYFAWSAGNFPDLLMNLTPYLTSEGLVRRLHLGPVREQPGGPVVLNRGLAYVDLERSKKLMFETYNYDAASRARPRGWVDRPSQSILSLYTVIYGTLPTSWRQIGDSVTAARSDSINRAVEANMDR